MPRRTKFAEQRLDQVDANQDGGARLHQRTSHRILYFVLVPEIIVTLFTQKHISHCCVRQLRISEHRALFCSR